jgi:superfamily II DNA or RNA helicase
VLIATDKLFSKDENVRSVVDGLPPPVRAMLIGDEVHNLGTPSFLDDLPERFTCRLGLSATPIRQYDAFGTERLLSFFGPIIFEFGLEEAIKAGTLTPYSYYLHEVVLSDEEFEKWLDLTGRLRRAGFMSPDDGETGGLPEAVQRLLEARRSVLEHAEAKITILERLLRSTPPSNVQMTLIYTSAKRDVLDRVKQIVQVNNLMTRLNIISHQLTAQETSTKRGDAILKSFADGEYQALTAMKVLDEGVDVPATSFAYLLASSTVRREWVQRRGRVLRKAPGKATAHIHDFLVIPPYVDTDEGRAILRGELDRAEEFARLATNRWATNGPRQLMERYERN